MIMKKSPFAIATIFTLLAIPSIAQDNPEGLPTFDNTEIFYLDPYRAPQNGSDASEFVHAMR
jgi:hypothetical protein